MERMDERRPKGYPPLSHRFAHHLTSLSGFPQDEFSGFPPGNALMTVRLLHSSREKEPTSGKRIWAWFDPADGAENRLMYPIKLL